MKELIEAIESQSEFIFVYYDGIIDLNKRINIDVTNKKVDQILEKVFESTDKTYRINDRQITIGKKDPITNEFILDRPEQQWGKQNKKITGSVTDEKGEALPGVSIIIKGILQGTVTDSDGNFSLTNVPDNAVLVFSFVGMKTQELKIGNKSVFDVVMEEQTTGLDEVVVVAYGKQKKETLTGSIASIQTDEIKQSPSANLSVALAGRLPGLTTIQTNGQPGQDNTILYLRGRSTTNGQDPLILVDGVPRDMTYIDPNEVESVSILKDASSTAVFGVRGANGVILITTRRGKNAKPEISFSSEVGLQSFTRFPDSLHSWEYAELRNQACDNDGLEADFSEEEINHYRNQDEPEIYPDNNWKHIMANDYSVQQRYNLSMNGSIGERANYFVNVGYLNQDGLWKVHQPDYDPSTWLKRYNFRSNIDIKLNKTLSCYINVAGYLETANQSAYGTDYIMSYTMIAPPTQPGPLTPDGEVLTTVSQSVPVYGMLNRSGYQQQKRSNVTASFGMEQDLGFVTKGLSTKAQVSFDTKSNYTLAGSTDFARYLQYVTTDAAGQDSVYYVQYGTNENTPLSLGTATTFNSYFNFQYFVNYNRSFGRHDVTGMALYQQDEKILQGDRLPYRYIGACGRFTYGFDHRYFAEMNLGYNGSEQFAKGNRFGFFPSLSASWVATNENFLKNDPILSMLKLRASYGKVGNDQLGSTRFLYLDNISVVGGGYSGSLGNGNFISDSYIGNKQVKWEIAKKINLGIDIGIFDQLDLSIDLFKEKRDNVLINRHTISNILGYSYSGSLPAVNMAEIKNHGYEVELNYHKLFSKDFSLTSKCNVSYAKNKIIDYDEVELSSAYAYRYRAEGYSFGQCWGYKIDREERYWNSQEEIDASGITYSGVGPRPGDFKYEDLNNDGIIDEKDYAPIKYTGVPEYTYGIALSLNYKHFDFSFLFQGVAHVSRGAGRYEYNGSDGVYNEPMKHSWTEERAANGEKIEYPALSTAKSSSHGSNEFFTQNCAYLRLKNLELGYTLPARLSGKIGASKIRFYLNGLNLYTWDHMISKDFDPEVATNLSYPIQKVINMGVNFIF
ncbi:MAG: TonB-dependent receptor [Mangrovibacterium sp.]